MFFAIIIYRIIDEVIKNKICKSVVVCLLSVCGCACSTCFSIRLPLGLDSSLASLLFIHVGNVIKNYRVIEKLYGLKCRGYLYYVCLLVLLLMNGFLISVNGDLNMRQAIWGFIPLTYLNGVMATILYWLFAMDLEKQSGMLIKWLCKISIYSIVYLCTNHLVIRYAERLLAFAENKVAFGNFIMREITVFILTMSVIYFIAEIISRTPLRIIIGRSKR